MPSDSGPSSHSAALPSHTLRWALAVSVATMCAIGLVLLFLLTQATNHSTLYERYYAWLLGMNVLVAVLLLAILLWVALRLGLRLQRKRFGSRLLVKLAGIFALVGLVPGLLIYVVSYQFVSRSIESWFDVKVEGALVSGVSLARVTLDTIATDMTERTRIAAMQLDTVPNATAGVVLEHIREQLDANDVVLWSASGHAIGSTGQSRYQLSPERPDPQQLRNAREQRATFVIEGLENMGHSSEAAAASVPHVRVKTLVQVGSSQVGLLSGQRFLQATLTLPHTLIAQAVAVQEANREYQERALARGNLRSMYISTLTLSLFLSVFGAVLLAVLLGNQLARPLLVLAEGVREVASGNFSPKAVLQGSDELDGLTRAFATMTQQLAEARASAERSMHEADAARANVQTILDNLTAGVVVLHASGTIHLANPGATRILRVPIAAYQGRSLVDVPGLADFAAAVQQQFHTFITDRDVLHGLDHWQHAFLLHAPAHGGNAYDGTSLVVRGAELPDASRLLVIDDITEIVSAQRAQAWGEVARRVAHEIKNPLTPIQLSAERLQMKLTGKLPETEQALLTKSVRTIVEQVAAMKRLVNEFRDYARMPAAQLQPLDLNALVTEVLHLYAGESSSAALQVQLDSRCPAIAGDAQQLRQVIHNLLQNAQDATQEHAQRTHSAPEPIRISTHWSQSSRRVRLTVTDSGPGFAPHILQRAFEPYVTTKSGGTGLGLAVVKKIADEHGARIELVNRIDNAVVRGAQVSLSFATERTVAL